MKKAEIALARKQNACIDAVMAGNLRRIKAWWCRCSRCKKTWRSASEWPPTHCSGCRSKNWWHKSLGRGRPRKVA